MFNSQITRTNFGDIVATNLITSFDGYYISYNDRGISLFGDVTTALVLGQMERFLS